MVDIAFQQITLRPHPSTPSDAIRGVDVRLSMPCTGMLTLVFNLRAEMSRIRVGTEAVPARAAGLWKHTCFEAFVQPTGSSGYYELNFSPTREWAAYRFGAYRDGMAPLDLPSPPEISVRKTSEYLEVQASFVLPLSPAVGGTPHARLALSAVVEEENGRLCYWSLRHPQGKPDFHHSEGFAFELSGPD
jgi:hypothetical protein